MKTPAPGLRVFHNSNTAQKFEIVLAAGAELVADLSVVKQLTAQSPQCQVDSDAVAAAKAEAEKAEADASAEAEKAAHLAYHRIAAEPEPEPAKKSPAKKVAAAKKAAAKTED